MMMTTMERATLLAAWLDTNGASVARALNVAAADCEQRADDLARRYGEDVPAAAITRQVGASWQHQARTLLALMEPTTPDVAADAGRLRAGLDRLSADLTRTLLPATMRGAL
jgi:hypothetical protein